MSPTLLRTRRYGVFWFSSLLSNIGTWMQSVAEPWLVLSLSGSPFLLGLDAFAMNAPFFLLALWGGSLADRKDRSLIIYVFSGIQMLCPLTIVILGATGWIGAASWIRVWIVIALSLIVGITDALSSPAFSSLIPSIVAKDELKPALALNSIQFNLSCILGPAIAGLVMMQFGYLWCFGANTLSYIPFFFSIYWLRPLARSANATESSAPIDLRATLKNRKITLALLSVFGTAFFCGPIITFSPVIVRDILHGSASQYGGALTAFGIGGILGPLLILTALKHTDPMKASLAAALTYGVILLTVAEARTLWQLAALLVASGFLLTVANTSANTFLQSQATNQNRGQTASLYMLAMRGGMSLGNLATGSVIGLATLKTAFMMNGILAIALQSTVLYWQSDGKRNSQSNSRRRI